MAQQVPSNNCEPYNPVQHNQNQLPITGPMSVNKPPVQQFSSANNAPGRPNQAMKQAQYGHPVQTQMQGGPFPSQVNGTNGNSNYSSRTASPAAPPGYLTSPNVSSSVLTPPKNDEGLSTPLNSSTPTQVYQPTNSVGNVVTGIQQMQLKGPNYQLPPQPTSSNNNNVALNQSGTRLVQGQLNGNQKNCPNTDAAGLNKPQQWAPIQPNTSNLSGMARPTTNGQHTQNTFPGYLQSPAYPNPTYQPMTRMPPTVSQARPALQPTIQFNQFRNVQQPIQQPPAMQMTAPQAKSGTQPYQSFPPINANQTNTSANRMQYQPNQPTSPQYIPPGASANMGFNSLWGQDTIDLLQNRHVLPSTQITPPAIKLAHQFHEVVNCSPDIFRCTLNKVPESNQLLQKSRLPFGILIHPFRDLNNLPVITSSIIVRCRVCRTYINPFVYFVDSKKWKCNLCYRVNDLPDEFLYDPVSKTYGDPTRRPEVKSGTIEFIAPSEYTLRPPQPSIFLFLLDVSSIAQQTGYLQVVCETIMDHLDKLPGDTRKQIGFIAYNSAVHFYNMAENFNQPHEVTVLDLEDIFLPYPDGLMVNLKSMKDLIKDLLNQLPKRFENQHDPHSSLGAALQAAYKLLSPTGGRITVFQTCLPNYGPGALQAREDPNARSSKDVQHLGPSTDFYKRMALSCSQQQIAVDIFLLNSQYADLATLSGVSKFSGGCIHHFPLFNAKKSNVVQSFKKCFERYLTRKIGFEAVMRVRCTRGLQIHTFHGNFFVRSTDLLSLPNINPDAGFGLQLSYEESLIDVKTVCFQAALLYTSSNGERRIRVHTLCVPVSASLTDIIHFADAQCIIGLLSKMAVDRSTTSSLTDARDAFINAVVDVITAYRTAQNLPASGGLMIAKNLALLPLYILALLKHIAFRIGKSTRLDDRVYSMCEMKSLPLDQLIKSIYPDFYCLDSLLNQQQTQEGEAEHITPEPIRLQLSAEHLDTRSTFLLDAGSQMILYVGSNVQPAWLKSIFGISNISELPDVSYGLQELKTQENEAIHAFIDAVNEDKPYAPLIQIIRDSTATRPLLAEHFIDDRNDNSLSYYEFLQHVRTQIK